MDEYGERILKSQREQKNLLIFMFCIFLFTMHLVHQQGKKISLHDLKIINDRADIRELQEQVDKVRKEME